MRRASPSLGSDSLKHICCSYLLTSSRPTTHFQVSCHRLKTQRGIFPSNSRSSILFPRVSSAGRTVLMFKSLYFFMEISDSLWTLWVQITRYDRQYSACQSQQWDNPADMPVSLPAALDDMFPSSSTHTVLHLDSTHTHRLKRSLQPHMWINLPLENSLPFVFTLFLWQMF